MIARIEILTLSMGIVYIFSFSMLHLYDIYLSMSDREEAKVECVVSKLDNNTTLI